MSMNLLVHFYDDLLWYSPSTLDILSIDPCGGKYLLSWWRRSSQSHVSLPTNLQVHRCSPSRIHQPSEISELGDQRPPKTASEWLHEIRSQAAARHIDSVPRCVSNSLPVQPLMLATTQCHIATSCSRYKIRRHHQKDRPAVENPEPRGKAGIASQFISLSIFNTDWLLRPERSIVA